MDNIVIKRPSSSSSTKLTLAGKRKLQHLCLDKGYSSKTVKQEIISRAYVPHLVIFHAKEEMQIKAHKEMV
jgi:hypothetical protein